MACFLYRDFKDGNLLIRFTCSFRSSVLYSINGIGLQYKYVVLDSMHKKNKWEILHGFSKDTNRLLLIPSDLRGIYAITQCNA